MKTFLNILLLGTIILGFIACTDEDKIYDLVLSKTSVLMEEDDDVTITIESGNGGYSVSFSPEGIVTAEVKDHSIIISGRTCGNATVTIKDGAGKSSSIEVTVNSYVQSNDTPRFKWNDYIELERVNNWSITIGTSRISITNVFEKKQYVVLWNGNLSVGLKPEAVLRIIEKGKETQVVPLTKLNVVSMEDDCCFIAFQSDSQRGEIVFNK